LFYTHNSFNPTQHNGDTLQPQNMNIKPITFITAFALIISPTTRVHTAEPNWDVIEAFFLSCTELIKMREKYGVAGDDHQGAFATTKLEKGKYYSIDAVRREFFRVSQITEDFILAAKFDKKPWAVLNFDNASALDEIRIEAGSFAYAIGRFIGYKEFITANGTPLRYPVFSCVGLQIFGQPYLNTESADTPKPPPIADNPSKLDTESTNASKPDIPDGEMAADNAPLQTPPQEGLEKKGIGSEADNTEKRPQNKINPQKTQSNTAKAAASGKKKKLAPSGASENPEAFGPGHSQEFQNWTNTQGKTVSARFGGKQGDNILLTTVSGQQHLYPIANLSAESKAQIPDSAGDDLFSDGLSTPLATNTMATPGAEPTAAVANSEQGAEEPPPNGFWSLDIIFEGTPYAGYSATGKKFLLHLAQGTLSEAGLYDGVTDGIPGPMTHKALVAFQRSKSLKNTGRFDAKLIDVLDLQGIPDNRNWVFDKATVNHPPQRQTRPPAGPPPEDPLFRGAIDMLGKGLQRIIE